MTDADLAALLAGTADAAPGLRPVADILGALTAEASSGELAGEDRALAEFRRRTGAPAAQAARPRSARLTTRFGVKVATVAAGAAVVLGGAATAAFANVLPAPIQRFAHETIGAPAPPARQATPDRGRSAVPGAPVSPGQPLVHGTPRAGHPAPHATAPGNPHGKGRTGNPHAHGKHGKPHGSGQQGNGKGGQGNGKGGGQGNGNGGQGNGQGDNGQGQKNNGQRRGGSEHAAAQHGSAHAPRHQGSTHTTAHRAVHPPGLSRGKPGTT